MHGYIIQVESARLYTEQKALKKATHNRKRRTADTYVFICSAHSLYESLVHTKVFLAS